MVQDLRTEKVFEELAMTSAKSESALWSILGFYFSIIFGLLAILILLKTVKIGRFLDLAYTISSTEPSGKGEEDQAQTVSTSQSTKKTTPTRNRKTSENKYARPPKSLKGSANSVEPTKGKSLTAPAKKSTPAMSPVRVGSMAAKTVESKTPVSSNKRKPEAPSTGRKKAKKDPNAPKKPLSAYLMFQNDKRAELTELHPQMSSNEITSLASHIWKNELTEDQKKPYLEKENELREQFKKEIAAYQAKKVAEGDSMEIDEDSNQSAEPLNKKGEKSPRRVKDPRAPKHPRTAFIVFNSNAEIRKALKEEFPDATPRDVMRMLGEKWANMKTEEKELYEAVAIQERATYKIEKEAYEKLKAAEKQGSGSEQKSSNTNDGLLGLIGSANIPSIGGFVSGLFGGTTSSSKTAPAEIKSSPTEMKSVPTKSSKEKDSPKKKSSIKKKVTPVKRKSPVKVPVLSAKRALRSGKRSSRSRSSLP